MRTYELAHILLGNIVDHPEKNIPCSSNHEWMIFYRKLSKYLIEWYLNRETNSRILPIDDEIFISNYNKKKASEKFIKVHLKEDMDRFINRSVVSANSGGKEMNSIESEFVHFLEKRIMKSEDLSHGIYETMRELLRERGVGPYSEEFQMDHFDKSNVLTEQCSCQPMIPIDAAQNKDLCLRILQGCIKMYALESRLIMSFSEKFDPELNGSKMLYAVILRDLMII